MAKVRTKIPLTPHSPKSRSTDRPCEVVWFGSEKGAAALPGVQQYMAEHGHWDFHYQWELADKDWLKFKGSGILINGHAVLTPAIARFVEKTRMPVVVINGKQDGSLPGVADDHAAIGVLAAEHLLERRVTHFGYCGSFGSKVMDFSRRRHVAFVQRIQQAGFSCDSFDISNRPPPKVALLGQWLTSLPKPCGIMCDYYALGKEVLAACSLQKLSVPEDVAIITVKGADEGLAPARIPLTYVHLNTHRVGYEGAALLDRLMSGERVPPGTTQWIAPQGIETGQSTDILAIPDPHVAAALRLIWQQACQGLQVADVLKEVPQSRPVIKRRFLQLVGRSMHDEIVRTRMNQIKNLLAQTDLTLAQIAERTGFKDTAYLIRAFHREVGVPPGKYRACKKVP